MVECAEKLPSTEPVTDAISVTQRCLDESWKHLEAIDKQLMKNPEMSWEDQLYFVRHSTTILIHSVLGLIEKHFKHLK